MIISVDLKIFKIKLITEKLEHNWGCEFRDHLSSPYVIFPCALAGRTSAPSGGFPSESEMPWGVRGELPVTLADGTDRGFFCNLGILLVVSFVQ